MCGGDSSSRTELTHSRGFATPQVSISPCVPVVPDMHASSFAGAVALALTCPQHAGLLAALLGSLNVVPFDRIADGLVSQGLELLHQAFVGARVDNGVCSRVGLRTGKASCPCAGAYHGPLAG